MRTVCEIDQCTGCMACMASCNKNAIQLEDSLLSLNAVIDESKCINCGKCEKVCQKRNPIEFRIPIYWKQGWGEETIREKSSSGGFAASIIKSFIANQGHVYACTYLNGSFIYRRVLDEKDIINFVGSKYVKSDPYSIYEEIRNDLNSDYRVLVIGLPCHIQGIQMYVGKLNSNLFTIDLICHGSPSQALFKKYLAEEKINLDSVESFDFRGIRGVNEKELNRVSSNSNYDYWLVPFKSALIYTENCYNCQYAKFERVSDLTLGDSWGSQLPKEQRKKGISLAMVNSDKGKELLDMTNLHLEEVDIQRAISANPQLKAPSRKPVGREEFSRKLGLGYKNALWKSSKKRIIKTMLKNSKFGSMILRARGYRQGSIEFRLTYSNKKSTII